MALAVGEDMASRVWLGFALLLLAGGCSSSTHQPAGETMGAVGSHVWFDSSQSLQLKEAWFFDTWGPDAGAPSSGSRCWTLDRAALTDVQLGALESIVLLPLTDACTSDGYRYFELDVADADGSSATYRDTGCSSLRVEGAKAMLPANAFDPTVFTPETAAACPE